MPWSKAARRPIHLLAPPVAMGGAAAAAATTTAMAETAAAACCRCYWQRPPLAAASPSLQKRSRRRAARNGQGAGGARCPWRQAELVGSAVTPRARPEMSAGAACAAWSVAMARAVWRPLRPPHVRARLWRRCRRSRAARRTVGLFSALRRRPAAVQAHLPRGKGRRTLCARRHAVRSSRRHGRSIRSPPAGWPCLPVAASDLPQPPSPPPPPQNGPQSRSRLQCAPAWRRQRR